MATALEHMLISSKDDYKSFDQGVTSVLPPGSRVVAVEPHGISLWFRTAKLTTLSASGEEKLYFIKVATGGRAKAMVSGEQLAMKTIHCISPTFIPEPIGWGAYTSIPDAYFTLYGFREMLKDWGFSVDVARFTKRLAEMHAGSSAIAPGGFGFPLTTHNGNLPQKNDWCSSWEDFFVAAMRYSLRLEEEAKGPSQELRQLSELLFENVIPRLLRPVELGPDQKGGAIKPCLIHGDLWIRNFSADPVTGEPFAYDSGAFWAHNEYEFGDWRSERSPITPEFFETYQKHFPASWPEEDFDDRNALYAMRFNLHDSTLFPSNPMYRRLLINDMRRLTEKHPDGLEGFRGWDNI